MANRVGPKGQIVIEKRIRDELGIEPGALAIQRIVDGHVEIHFIPEHRRSLYGSLANYGRQSISEEEWHEAKEAAWRTAVEEKFGRRPE
jgi:AbrB family looped-hinge helix DNA binding protein